MDSDTNLNFFIKNRAFPEGITNKELKKLLGEKDPMRNSILHYIFYDADTNILKKFLYLVSNEQDNIEKVYKMLSSSNISGNSPLSLITDKYKLSNILEALNKDQYITVNELKDKYDQTLLHFISKFDDIKAEELFKIMINHKYFNVGILEKQLTQLDTFGNTVINRLKDRNNNKTIDYLKKILLPTIKAKLILLNNNKSIEIATINIKGETYKILCKHGVNIKPIIENRSIVIQKENWSHISNNELIREINSIKLAGTKKKINIVNHNISARLSCGSIDFNSTMVQKCQDITKSLSILDTIQKLDNIYTISKQITKITINGKNYQIFFKYKEYNNVSILNNAIIIERNDWISITNKELKRIISNIILTGTDYNIKIVKSNASINFNMLKFIKHYDFTNTTQKIKLFNYTKPLSLLNKVQMLDNYYNSVEVGHVLIKGKQYQIICKKGDEGTQIIKESIVISKSHWTIISNDEFKKLINSIYLTGTMNLLRVSENNQGIRLNCKNNHFEKVTLLVCNDITDSLSILHAVQEISHSTTQSKSVEIAKVTIGIKTYTIVCNQSDDIHVKISNNSIIIPRNNWSNVTNKELEDSISQIQLTNTKKKPAISRDDSGVKVFDLSTNNIFSQTRSIINLNRVEKIISILDGLQELGDSQNLSILIANVEINNKTYKIICNQSTNINNIIYSDSIIISKKDWSNITNKDLQDTISQIIFTYENSTLKISSNTYGTQLNCNNIKFDKTINILKCTKITQFSIIEKVKNLENGTTQEIANINVENSIYLIRYTLHANSGIRATIKDKVIDITGTKVYSSEKLSSVVNMFSIMKINNNYFIQPYVTRQGNLKLFFKIDCLPQAFSEKHLQSCGPEIDFKPISYWVFLIKNYNAITNLSRYILNIIEESQLKYSDNIYEINNKEDILLVPINKLKHELTTYYFNKEGTYMEKNCLRTSDCHDFFGFFSKKITKILLPNTNTWLDWENLLKVKLPFEGDKTHYLTLTESAKINQNIAIKNFLTSTNSTNFSNDTLTFYINEDNHIRENSDYLSNITNNLKPVMDQQSLSQLARHICINMEWIQYVDYYEKESFIKDYNELFFVKGSKFHCKLNSISVNEEKHNFINTLNFIVGLENFYLFLKEEEEVIPGVYFGSYKCNMHNECQDFTEEVLKVFDDNLQGYNFAVPYNSFIEFLD